MDIIFLERLKTLQMLLAFWGLSNEAQQYPFRNFLLSLLKNNQVKNTQITISFSYSPWSITGKPPTL